MARKKKILISNEIRRLQAKHLWEYKQFFIATDEVKKFQTGM